MRKIPCMMTRGGTLRDAFLLAEHLPEDRMQRDKVLVVIMSFDNDLEIDGTDNGNPLTSKVAIISRSNNPHADIDYLFTQTIVHGQRVDATPNCGNMLSGVGAFAIESGLIVATSLVTRVHIHNVNTGMFIEADVQTPNGVVEYEGSARIDGVPGTAALVVLILPDAVGTKTGKVFPTDNQIDCFDDVPVTCIDMAMSVVIISAEYLGKTDYELSVELDADKTSLARIESTRLQAGKAIGLGDVSNMVVPEPILISPTQRGGTINMYYFMPRPCHRALVITGAIAISSSCALEGTVTRRIALPIGYGSINTEHPSSALNVHLNNEDRDTMALRASVVRTTRKMFFGEVYLP